ncbi:MAG: YraN family protein [Dehalococcoidia bacterium]
MSGERAALGAFGERLAAGHLRRAGYEIVATNVQVRPWGEIDIVARRDGVLVLVEVRTRRGDRFGGAAWSITPAKQRRMLRAATVYLGARIDETPAARIDVVLVHLDARGRLIGIEHIENAVEE